MLGKLKRLLLGRGGTLSMFDALSNKPTSKAEQAAMELLIETGAEGIYPFPFDDVVDKIGYNLAFFNPSEKTKEMSGAVDRTNKIILINKKESTKRQFFTIAHEIGHIRLHPDNHVDFRTPLNTPEEAEANEFAANLLMPAPKFIEIYNQLAGNIFDVANFFFVSTLAAQIRARKLGLVR